MVTETLVVLAHHHSVLKWFGHSTPHRQISEEMSLNTSVFKGLKKLRGTLERNMSVFATMLNKCWC